MPNRLYRSSILILILLAAATLLAVGAAGTAVAQDQVVSDSSPNPNCDAGTVTHNNIQSAVNDAQSGDTIVVCPGVYNEAVTVNESVRIVADKPDATDDANRSVLRDVDGNGTAFTVTANNVSIEGFSIDNYSDAGVAVATSSSLSGINVNRTAVEGSGSGVLLAADNGSLSGVTLEELALSSNDEGIIVTALNGSTISSVEASELFVNQSSNVGVAVLANASTASGVSVTESRVNDTNGLGVLMVGTNGGTVEAVNVSTIEAESNENGIGVLGDGGTVRNVTISESLVHNQDSIGIGVLTQDGGTVSQVTVSRAVANGSDVGVYMDGSTGTMSDVTFEETDLGASEGNAQAGLFIANGTASNYDNVTVTRSLIRNNEHGILVDSNVTSDLTRSDVNVSYNIIRNNSVGVQNNNTNTVFDARLNYWGDSSGPSSTTSEPLEDPLAGVLANGNGDAVSEGQSGVSNVRFAPSIGGKRTCEDGQLFDPIPDETIETSLEGETIGGPITDFVGFCLWERSVLPLRTTSASAAQSILNIPTFIDTGEGQVPINRQEINVYEKNQQVNVTYEQTTGANTTRYANKTGQVLIARVSGQGLDDAASIEDLFTADFDPVSGSATFGTDSVEFVAVRNVTLDADGTLPQGVQFTPSNSGSYVAVLTANEVGDGYALDNDGNLTGNVHENDVTAIGFESIAVRETASSATPDNTTVQTGQDVTFELDAGFGSESTSMVHGVVMYNEDNFTDSTLVLSADGNFDVENLTVENGTVNATLTAPDGTTENVTLEVTAPIDIQSVQTFDDVQDNITVAGKFTLIDSAGTATSAGRTATLTVNTQGFDNGTYRYIHVAAAEDGRFATDDGTINVGCEPIPQAIDMNDNGLIDDQEILAAIDQYWRTNTPVPGACVGAIPAVEDDNPNNILKLIELWRTDTPVNGGGT